MHFWRKLEGGGCYSVGILSFEEKDNVLQRLGPEIENILRRPEATWGPKMVEVVVKFVDGEQATELYQLDQEWQPEWGDAGRFWDVAIAKANLAGRTGMSTREVRDNAPLLLREGDFLWAGGVPGNGFAVGVSGAREDTDEEIAFLVRDAFHTAAAKEVTRRRVSGDDALMAL